MNLGRNKSNISNRWLSIAALVCLISAGTAVAEPDLSHPLTVDECVEIALEGNRSINQSRTSVDQAKGGTKTNLNCFLPNLSAQTSWSKSGGEQNDWRGLSEDEAHSSNLSWQIQQPILDLSGIWSWRSSKASQYASEYDLANTIKTTEHEVRSQFFSTLASIKFTEVETNAVEVANEQLRRAETLFRLGSVARSDVLQAKVNLAQAEYSLINRRNEVRISYSRLAIYMGVDPRLDFTISEDVDIPQTDPEGDINEFIDYAFSNRIDLAAARARLHAAELSATSAMFSWMPYVNSSYGRSYNSRTNDAQTQQEIDLGIDETTSSENWSLSVRASLTIFDGMARQGRQQTATAQKRSRQIALSDSEDDAALDVKDSYLSMHKERESLRSAQSSVSLSEENLRLQQALYESGAGTLLEWDNARLDLRRAQGSLIQASLNLKLSHIRFERALGN
jgi:outer membrane protein TolC